MDDRKPLRRRSLRYPMPALVQKALLRHGLMRAYRSRPPYQQNDYLGWIGRAKWKETQEKRLVQMLQELQKGDSYMNMEYHPKRLRTVGKK